MSADGKHWDGRECWLCKRYPLPLTGDEAMSNEQTPTARWWSTDQQRWIYPGEAAGLDIETLAREADCVHVDLDGDHAKALERLTAFAELVLSVRNNPAKVPQNNQTREGG